MANSSVGSSVTTAKFLIHSHPLWLWATSSGYGRSANRRQVMNLLFVTLRLLGAERRSFFELSPSLLLGVPAPEVSSSNNSPASVSAALYLLIRTALKRRISTAF